MIDHFCCCPGPHTGFPLRVSSQRIKFPCVVEGARFCRSLVPAEGRKTLKKKHLCYAAAGGEDEVHLKSTRELSDGSTLFVFEDGPGDVEEDGEVAGHSGENAEVAEEASEEGASDGSNSDAEEAKAHGMGGTKVLSNALEAGVEKSVENTKSEASHEGGEVMNHGTLSTWKVIELRQKCKDLGIKGYSKLRKDELVETLLEWSK